MVTQTSATDFESIVNKIEQAIKGYEFKDGQYQDTGRVPYLDPKREGYSKVMTVVRSYLGTHFSFSNLTTPYIRVACKNLYVDLFLDFNKNMERYGFSSKESVDIVLDMIMDTVMATMLRALKGEERKRYYDSLNQSINSGYDNSPSVRMG